MDRYIATYEVNFVQYAAKEVAQQSNPVSSIAFSPLPNPP